MSVGVGANTLDLAGQRFGRWVVLSWAGTDAQRGAKWLCRCDCGVEKVVRRRNLVVPGQTVSCGCHRIDMRKGLVKPGVHVEVGAPVRLMPLRPPKPPRTAETRKWRPDAPGRAVMAELQRERMLGNQHGLKHGLGGTPTYNSWKKMIQRCYTATDPDFAHYGGRGIAVCERWRTDPRNFLADMGEKPAFGSIERLDVEGDYEPGNCTWLPHRYQSKNRRPWKHTQEGLARISEARRRKL